MFGEGIHPKIYLNILKLYLGKFLAFSPHPFLQKVHNSVIFILDPLPLFVEKGFSLTWLIWAQKKEELTKRRSKVQEKIMSCECALNFDQWKTFSEL